MTAEIYKGEIQLAGWSETHNGGAKITLWLPDSEALTNFKELTARKGNTAGQILAAMITTVDYDQDFSEPASESKEPELKGGKLARLAGMLINNPQFWQHLDSCCEGLCEFDRDSADAHLKTVCGITSKTELDNFDWAAENFHRHIRQPFLEWQEKK